MHAPQCAHAHADKPLFQRLGFVVGNCNCTGIVEDGPGFLKPHAKLTNIGIRFDRIPFEAHASLYVQVSGTTSGR